MQKQETKKAEKIGLFLRIVVKDEHGKVVKDTGEMESKSYVLQFLQYIYGFMRNLDITAKDTSNNNTLIFDADRFCNEEAQIGAPINNSTYGVVIGTDTPHVALSNTDYKLASQLTEGVALGQITHNESIVFAVPAIVGANVDEVLSRSFTNLTGATISVKEAGIYVNTFWLSANRYYCVIRDLVSPAVDVPNLNSITVFYTIRTTV